jgi:hypothetical protein
MPEKSLRHISLFSGGEKALSALSLLFALYLIKPTPFGLLDEFDRRWMMPMLTGLSPFSGNCPRIPSLSL